ncbi:related to Laccase-2 [Cephalotrichum gorgonifer]|uniref:laccase n=1 Tax=Cephalotrichum gorgonifer TaxID=2041049 RepID=A0AAE8N5E2_9PEZI|nr:related to Laccase-2 [Cephalotrichum gorgonifer]
MHSPSLLRSALSGLALGSAVLGEPIPHKVVPQLKPRQTIIPGGKPCGEHGPTNRGCWMNNWTIDKENEIDPPPAFKNWEYDLYITNETAWEGPDGVVKPAMLVNGGFPGPTIEANWGDYVVVNVHNQLQDNGTSIHWHGIRQIGESDQDGANGVTECPIPPGTTKTYAFHVVQYGTSWWHSHYSSQYGNGVVGAMVVNGPATANYDIDLGPYIITDYYHQGADLLQRIAELPSGGPPDAENILFRGKGKHKSGTGGSYDRLVLTPGKTHRVRLINTSVDNSFTVSLVGHSMKIIQIDMVPVEPDTRDHIFLAVGQRYDVIIEANKDVGNYWFNATLQSSGSCGVCNNAYPAAIFSYEGADQNALPTDRGTPITATCDGEKGLVPYLRRVLDPADFHAEELNINLTQPEVDFRGTVFRWEINDVDIDIEWDHPILEYVYEGNVQWNPKANIIEIPDADVWTYWIIQNNFFIPHPVHLHGHDFLVLGSGTGRFNRDTHFSQLEFNNPVRRDVEQIPGSGWLVIAFYTDNPGAWLLHCHIGWHVSQGFGMQFLERASEINRLMNLNQMVPNCDAWRAYAPTNPWLPKLDSGLKK